MTNQNDKKWTKKLSKKKKELQEISDTFCAAKWLQLTLHLQNGMTHSCHHPSPHKIPLSEIKDRVGALHNTKFKIKQRSLMKIGKRPTECEHCWTAEDSSPETFSDRIIKSADDWAQTDLVKLKRMNYPNPTYLEVSFGNKCNLRCSYCSPEVSSAIWNEFEKHGPYPVSGSNSIEWYKENKRKPYAEDAKNPYVIAFRKWFPQILSGLKVFRITGGEPLINKETFETIRKLKSMNFTNLEFSINTNLMVSDKVLDQLSHEINELLKSGKFKEIRLFTSVDTFGEQAEWIRFGLNYKKLFENCDYLLRKCPDLKLTFIVTFNLLSIPNFKELLKDILAVKKKFISKLEPIPRIMVDINHLRFPTFLSPLNANRELKASMGKSFDYMLHHHETKDKIWGFNSYEANKMNRLIKILSSSHVENDSSEDLIAFINEYDRRKKTDFKSVFPQFKTLFISREQVLPPEDVSH